MSEPERRLKRMFVKDEDILAALIARSKYHQHIFTFPGLPSDTYIKHIHYDFDRYCITLILYSEEFEVVPKLNIIPIIETEYKVVKDESFMQRKPML
jgi:hypothetical protein